MRLQSSAKRNTIGSTPSVYTGNELIPRFTTVPLTSHTLVTVESIGKRLDYILVRVVSRSLQDYQ